MLATGRSPHTGSSKNQKKITPAFYIVGGIIGIIVLASAGLFVFKVNTHVSAEKQVPIVEKLPATKAAVPNKIAANTPDSIKAGENERRPPKQKKHQQPNPKSKTSADTAKKASPSAVRKSKHAGDRTVLTIQGVEYPFRWCPAGTFMMGSPEADETQHQVTLTQGFWMLETEVTQAMWTSVMGSNPS